MPRVMEITTPLGPDVLLFHQMHAREEMSRVPSYQLVLLSRRGDVNLDEMLGKTVTVKLRLQDDTTRYFNGYVTRFSQGGTHGRYFRYYAEVHSWLWFLSRTADCRIFQEMTVPDIVKKVFGEEPTHSFKTELTNSYRKWNYCVQYRETDLNFVSRLMEHEGIYYYVKHADGRHTVVLTDSYSGHEPFQNQALPFIAPEDLARPDIEHVSAWNLTREIQPGAYVHDDYDLERPSVELRAQKAVPRDYTPSKYEVFDYPGYYVQKPHGEQYAAVRIDEFAAQFETVQGITNARDLSVGYLFKLEKSPREDQNREHLVVAATHDLEYSDYEAMPDRGGAEYRCSFVAMSSKQQFRPKRLTPKPFVQGPQTAVVVGPGGEEIYTDKYGRVKVLFHWDREGEKKKDENSSCWVRVSQPWAGKAWGGVAIPRIGQEVIVDFLEGDPDQPIITGRVYNAEQMPPYALPANMTQTGIKSRSSMGGTPDNFNEIRFEDKKGEEQLFIHAEKNQDIEVEHDETHWVGHDRTKTIDNDETSHIKHDRKKTVDNDETTRVNHDRTESVGNNETITIGENRTESVGKDESIRIGNNRTENVGEDETIQIGRHQSVSIAGNKTLTITKNESISIGENRTDQVAKNEDISVGKSRQVDVAENDSLQVGKKLLVDAGDQITIQTGSASITMKKDGSILIKGKDITIDGSGKINVKASSDVVIKGSKVMQN
jgi:type VI secretion system secreted protein VgrG